MEINFTKLQWSIILWLLGVFIALIVSGGIKIADMFNTALILLFATICIFALTDKKFFVTEQPKEEVKQE